MIMEILQYIRSLIPGHTTKRKRTDDDFSVHFLPKQRKMTHKNGPEDDWIRPSMHLFTKKASNTDSVKLKSLWSPSNVPIVIDDDDEDNSKKFNGTTSKAKLQQFSSTPKVNSKENGFDFSTFGKHGTDRRQRYKENGCDLISPRMFDLSRPLSKPEKVDLTPNTSAYFTPGVRSFTNLHDSSKLRNTPAVNKKTMGSLLPDFTFRLEDKRRYEELLRRSSSSSSINFDSFMEYSTPTARSPVNQRTKRIIDLTRNINSKFAYDLTNESRGPKTATSQAIKKVLDNFDNDVVVLKDSDSDVEEVAVVKAKHRSPPSPKPDIKVDRVNSLKNNMGVCDALQDGWIHEKVRKHHEELASMGKELQLRKDNLVTVRKINEELIKSQLSEQVKKCLRIREAVIPITEDDDEALPELTEDHLLMVESAFSKSCSMNEVLSSKFSLNITRRDMHTLAGLNWLNDEVINFYMNLIIERGKLEKYPSVYAFNTFFYPKILREGQSGVRRWTRRVDIFAHDLVCVPIHLSMHWCMAVIDFRRKCVFYYDSMGKPNHQCTEALIRYIRDEHKDKKGAELDVSGWKQNCVKNIPQQMNGSDCGMFACTYAEFQSRNAPFTFTQQQMPYFRKKMVVEIMLGSLLIT